MHAIAVSISYYSAYGNKLYMLNFAVKLNYV